MAYTFNPFTGTFDNAPSTLNGDSAYSTLCAISGDLVNYEYLHDGFLPLSGGTVTGNLSVEGGFEVNGTAVGPATIYAGGSLVGINTETPNEELTVSGDISASGIIYGDASGLINVVDSEVRSLSSNWESTYTTFRDASSTFLTSETDSQTLSYNETTYELSISNGNTVSLSALSASTEVFAISAESAKVVFANVFNADTTDLTQGTVVYTFGAQGDTMSVKKASNQSDETSARTLGFVDGPTIAPGSYGRVIIAGQITKMAFPGATFNEGDPLFLGNAPGTFTNVEPTSPLHSVYLGVVERANSGNGLAYVKVQNGYELYELHDVLITSVASGQVIRRNNANNLWINTNDSLNWDSTYSTISSLSSFWDSTTTAYTQASGTFATTEYVHTNFLPLTGGTVDGNLDVTGTTNLSGETSIGAGATATLHVADTLVGINTETPNEELTVVGDISATGVIYGSASGLIDVVDSDVRSLTANWESTYNTVSSLSALWEESAEILPTVTNYLSTNNVLISSLTLIETLSVGGALEVGGGGAGTDLFVGTSTVGINTESPNEALTVNGSISANNLIYDETGNSSQWNSVYSSVTLTSANWDSAYSYTNSVSSDLVFTDTSNTTPGLSAVTKIVAVSALPATQETGTLYILI